MEDEVVGLGELVMGIDRLGVLCCSYLEWLCCYDAYTPSGYCARCDAVELDSLILRPAEEFVVDLHRILGSFGYYCLG